MSSRIGITQWGIIIIFGSVALALLMAAALVLKLYQSTLIGTVLLSIAVSFLSTIVVFVFERFVPRAEAKVQVKRGHEAIYEKYRDCLESLAKGELHDVRTVASLPPSQEVAGKWDSFLVPLLENRSDIRYTRVIVVNDANKEWERRKGELKDRYLAKKLVNYEQFETKGPPSIECLLVDNDVAFVSFASAGRLQESFCLIVKDRKVCKELENYFDQLTKHCTSAN